MYGNNKIIAIVSAVLLLAVQGSVAGTRLSQPAKCPGVDAIKNAREGFVVEKSSVAHDVIQESKYDTNQTWVLRIRDIDFLRGDTIKTKQDMINKAKTVIKFIVFDGDEPQRVSGHWLCTFKLPSVAGLTGLSEHVDVVTKD